MSFYHPELTYLFSNHPLHYYPGAKQITKYFSATDRSGGKMQMDFPHLILDLQRFILIGADSYFLNKYLLDFADSDQPGTVISDIKRDFLRKLAQVFFRP